MYGTTSLNRDEDERVSIVGYGALEVRLAKSANTESTGYDLSEVRYNIDPAFDASQYSDIEIYVKRSTPSNNPVILEPDTDIAEDAQLVVDRLYRKVQELENRLNGVVHFPVEFRGNNDSDSLDQILRTPNIVPGDSDTPHLLLYQLNAEGEMTLGWTQNIDEIHSIAQLVDGSVLTEFLADQSVTTAKIADEAVTTAKIADNNVTTDKILDRNVTRDKIEDGAVGGSQLAENSILSRHFGSVVVSLPTVNVTGFSRARSVQNINIPFTADKFGFAYVDLSTGSFLRDTDAEGNPLPRPFQLNLDGILEGGVYELLVKKFDSSPDPIIRIYGPQGSAGTKVVRPGLTELSQQGGYVRVLVFARSVTPDGDDLDIYILPSGSAGGGGGSLDLPNLNLLIDQTEESESISSDDQFVMDRVTAVAGKSHISGRQSLEDINFLGASILDSETETITSRDGPIGSETTTVFKAVSGPEVQLVQLRLGLYNGVNIGNISSRRLDFTRFNSSSNTRKALVVENLLGVPEHSALIFRPPSATQTDADVWLVTDRDDLRIDLVLQEANLSSSITSTFQANQAALALRGRSAIDAGIYHWNLTAAQAARMFQTNDEGDALIRVFFDVLDSTRGGVEEERVIHSFADVWYESSNISELFKVSETTVIQKIDDVLVAPKVNILAKQIDDLDGKVESLESTSFDMTLVSSTFLMTPGVIPDVNSSFVVTLFVEGAEHAGDGSLLIIIDGQNVAPNNVSQTLRNGLNSITASIPDSTAGRALRGNIVRAAERDSQVDIQVRRGSDYSNILHLPYASVVKPKFKQRVAEEHGTTGLIVSANMDRNLARMDYSNLVIGRKYKATISYWYRRGGSGQTQFWVFANQGEFISNPNRANQVIYDTADGRGGFDSGCITREFTATATTFQLRRNSQAGLFSYYISVLLEELTDKEETTDWD